MSRQWSAFRFRIVLVGLSASLLLFAASSRLMAADAPAAKPIPVERLLPARTVFLWQDEGFQAHQVAYGKTAASDALSATGVYDLVSKMLEPLLKVAEADASSLAVVRHVIDHGFSLCVSLPEGKTPALPRLTIVLHEAGDLTKPWEKAFEAAKQKAAAKPATKSDKEPDPKKNSVKKLPPAEEEKPAVAEPTEEKSDEGVWAPQQMGPRLVWSAKIKPMDGTGLEVDYATWTEGRHLVLVCGFGALDQAIGVAEGRLPNITTHRLWKELHQGEQPFSRRSLGWVDVASLREAFDALPVPPVEDLAEMLPLMEMFSGLFGGQQVAGITEDGTPMVMPAGTVVTRIENGVVVQPVGEDEEIKPVPSRPAPKRTGKSGDDELHADADTRLSAPAPYTRDDVQYFPVGPENGLQRQLKAIGAYRARQDVVYRETFESEPLEDSPPSIPAALPPSDLPPPLLPPLPPDDDSDLPPPTGIDPPLKPDTDEEGDKGDDGDKDAPPVEIAAEDPYTVKQIVTAVGLDSVQDWTWQSGYRGRAQWSESHLRLSGPRPGLLGFGTTQTMTIKELPPLPADIGSFSAMTADLNNVGQSLKFLFKNAFPLIATPTAGTVDDALAELPQHVDLVTLQDIASSLDRVVCTYNDGANGPLTIGPVLAWKVKDAAKLRAAINRSLESIDRASATPPAAAAEKTDKGSKKPKNRDDSDDQAKEENDDSDDDSDDNQAQPEAEESNPFLVTRKTKFGREIVTFGCLGNVALVVDDQWLVVSINSQLVEAFLLRLDGKLQRWKPSPEHLDALKDLPEKFTSITVDDPRRTLPYLFSLAPAAMGWIESVIELNADDPDDKVSLPKFDDFPPAEMIVQPLFPNFTVTVADEQGTRTYSRTSLQSVSMWNVAPFMLLGGLVDFDPLELLNW